jgi:hypothetical protein
MTEQKPDTGNNPGEPPDQEQRGSPGPRSESAASGSNVHTPEADGKGGKAYNEDKHWLDYATGVFAFIAAIGGGIAAIAGWYQASVAKDAEKISSRAYITSTSFQMINYGKKDNNGHLTWQLSPAIENTGNTSTRFMEIKAPILGGVARGFNFSATISRGEFEHASIPPRSTILGGSMGFSVGLPPGVLPIIAIGIVKYGDVFGDRHLTEYCYEFFPYTPIDLDNYPAGQPIRVVGATFIEGCEKHNCEDDECGADWKQRATE